MEKEKEGSGGKVKKVSFIILAIIGVLAIILFAIAFLTMDSKDENIEKITALESDYTKNYNLFNTEYGVADPNQVTSLSVLPRAVTGAKEAKKHLITIKDNVTSIIELVDKIKTDYSGDKLNWFNKLEECYNAESNRVDLYDEILSNELTYFDYYENSQNYWKTSEEFAALLKSYLINAQQNNEQGLVDDINKIKVKVSAMKSYAQKSYKAIPFIFYQKREIWADKFNQGLDLQLKYLASPSQDTLKQMNDKFNEATMAVEGVTDTSVKEEFDKWYNEKITLKKDEVDRLFNSADSSCSEASDLFATAFPGNANAVKEVETTD